MIKILYAIAIIIGVWFGISTVGFIVPAFGMMWADLKDRKFKAFVIFLVVLYVMLFAVAYVIPKLEKHPCKKVETIHVIYDQQSQMCKELKINHWEKK